MSDSFNFTFSIPGLINLQALKYTRVQIGSPISSTNRRVSTWTDTLLGCNRRTGSLSYHLSFSFFTSHRAFALITSSIRSTNRLDSLTTTFLFDFTLSTIEHSDSSTIHFAFILVSHVIFSTNCQSKFRAYTIIHFVSLLTFSGMFECHVGTFHKADIIICLSVQSAYLLDVSIALFATLESQSIRTLSFINNLGLITRSKASIDIASSIGSTNWFPPEFTPTIGFTGSVHSRLDTEASGHTRIFIRESIFSANLHILVIAFTLDGSGGGFPFKVSALTISNTFDSSALGET